MMKISLIVLCLSTGVSGTDAPATDRGDAVQKAVDALIENQQADGAWPYEGVYRVRGEIPLGYRIGGTALVCQALMHAAPKEHAKTADAIQRGIGYILEHLSDPLMRPSKRDAYDVRIWGQACALEFFCRWRVAKRGEEHVEQIDQHIRGLVGAILFEEIDGGGWNYSGQRRHAVFVTAPVVQALMWARAHGENIDPSVFRRSRQILNASRIKSGAFFYSGTADAARRVDARAEVPGSIARSPLCEVTLSLLGAGSNADLEKSLTHFFEHWEELEKRRKKTGTHKGPFGIAPYYFYFAHRYAAQAIEMLPSSSRPALRDRLDKVVFKTGDSDGTWNDRVFKRSRNYGTAMILMAIAGQQYLTPPAANIIPQPSGE